MSKATVAIKRQDSYDQQGIDNAIAEQFELLGVANDIRPGMKVLLKPNLLTGRKPELAVTTHPTVIRAVAKWLRERGVTDITLADSPGGPYMPQTLGSIYKACQLIGLEPDVKLNYNTDAKERPAAPGSSQDKFNLIQPVHDADYIINLAKMKTHGMTLLSLGTKNLFGTIPGLQKPQLHYSNPSIEGFSNMLVSLAETVKPNLTVIDAIFAMEGDGPSGGTVRNAGILMASKDLFAQDYVAARLMGVEPDRVWMIKIARQRGLYDPADIEVVGDEVAPFEPPFQLPETTRVDFTSHLPGPLADWAAKLIDRFVKPFPVVTASKCVGCAKCQESCPQQIIQIVDKKAVINTRRCISCFCCQEMCPAKAIGVEKKIRL